MQRNSVLEWPEGPPPAPPEDAGVRVERFKPGVRRVVVFLGDPVERHTHWHPELRKSVPCYEPRWKVPEGDVSRCPHCTDARFGGTRRREGYAPVMERNDHRGRWEQAVAVLTSSGLGQLDQLDPASYRGRAFEVFKAQRGTSTPMSVKELDTLSPTEFPDGLPANFSVRAVMLRVWFPEREHADPVERIDPVPIAKRRPRPAAQGRETMDVPPEFLEDLRAHGLPNLAAKFEADLAAVAKAAAPAPVVERVTVNGTAVPFRAPSPAEASARVDRDLDQLEQDLAAADTLPQLLDHLNERARQRGQRPITVGRPTSANGKHPGGEGGAR